MKKIIAIIVSIAAVSCCAQTTPNIGLNLPSYASPNWNIPLNQNFSILDNYLGGVNTFPNALKASITGSAANLSGGVLGSVPYQVSSGSTLFVSPNTSTTQKYLCETGTGLVGAAPAWCSGSGTGTVTSFSAPSASWPSWLVPTVTNSTSTPSLAVTSSGIPTSALSYAYTTVNGTTCTLGSTCTITAAAGTLTGSTLASGVTGSSLASVGTITSGTWQGTPIANSYLANNYTTVNGQVCTLGSSCTITSSSALSLSGGALGSVPYQAASGVTSFVPPNTTSYTYYLCEMGTGVVGAAPSWCAGSGGGTGTVTSVGISMPSTQFTVSGSPVTTSGIFSVTLNSPTGTGNLVLSNSPTITGTLTAANITDSSLTTAGYVTNTSGGVIGTVSTIPNSGLTNSSMTVNGTTCTLGSSCAVTTSPYSLTMTDGASTSKTYNGSSAITLNYLSTTETSSQTIASILEGSKDIVSQGFLQSSCSSVASADICGAVNLETENSQWWVGQTPGALTYNSYTYAAGSLELYNTSYTPTFVSDATQTVINTPLTINGTTLFPSGTSPVYASAGVAVGQAYVSSTYPIYVCLTAGSVLPAGSMTMNSSACGSSQSTGFSLTFNY